MWRCLRAARRSWCCWRAARRCVAQSCLVGVQCCSQREVSRPFRGTAVVQRCARSLLLLLLLLLLQPQQQQQQQLQQQQQQLQQLQQVQQAARGTPYPTTPLNATPLPFTRGWRREERPPPRRAPSFSDPPMPANPRCAARSPTTPRAADDSPCSSISTSARPPSPCPAPSLPPSSTAPAYHTRSASASRLSPCFPLARHSRSRIALAGTRARTCYQHLRRLSLPWRQHRALQAWRRPACRRRSLSLRIFTRDCGVWHHRQHLWLG